MDSPSSSRRPNRLKLTGFGSRKSGYFVQDNGLVSLVDSKDSYSPYLTSNLASRNASSSAGTRQPGYVTALPPRGGSINPSSCAGNYYQQQMPLTNDLIYLTGNEWPSLPYHNAISSAWNYQPSFLNYLAGNGLASIAENPSSQPYSCYNLLPCNGLASLADYASSSAAAAQRQQPNYYTFLACDNGLASLAANASASAKPSNPFTFLNTSNMLASLSVADQASSSSSEKKQEQPASTTQSSFLTKPVPENFAFQAEKPPMFFVCPPEEPEPRFDLKRPILPKTCVRCNSPFDFGKEGAIYMYKDRAYCSWDCRQVLIDIDHPPKRGSSPLMKKSDGYKKRKTTPAPRG